MNIKLLLILNCCFAYIAAMAQIKNTEKDYKLGIGVQVNTIEKFSQYENIFLNVNNGTWQHKSYSLGIISNLNLNENYLLRLKAGITKIHILYHFDTKDYYPIQPEYYSIADQKAKQSRYYFAPGIVWQLNKKLYGLYGGFELPLTIHGDYDYSLTQTEYDSTFTTVTFDSDCKTTVPGGFTFGVGAFTGFYLNFLKHFSFGAEFSSALLYSKLGGKSATTALTIIPPNNPPITSSVLYEVKGFNYAAEKFSINLIYIF